MYYKMKQNKTKPNQNKIKRNKAKQRDTTHPNATQRNATQRNTQHKIILLLLLYVHTSSALQICTTESQNSQDYRSIQVLFMLSLDALST